MQIRQILLLLYGLFLFSSPMMFAQNSSSLSAYKAVWRDYYFPLTKKQKENIEYIVSTLGNDSLLSIAGKKSSLQKAGGQIAEVHPLQFLKFVFLEEKLKASIHNMKGRSWVWSEFLDGLKKSLEMESKRENLTEDLLEDFALQLNLSLLSIDRLVKNKKWGDLVDFLIAEVPRDGNATRYDM